MSPVGTKETSDIGSGKSVMGGGGFWEDGAPVVAVHVCIPACVCTCSWPGRVLRVASPWPKGMSLPRG